MASERSQNISSGTGQARVAGQREQFSAEELAIILSHFDIGVVDSIVEFPRGSRKAPKLLIVSEQGKFLLKRRARGKDDPFKVAFTHALQLFLASKQFPRKVDAMGRRLVLVKFDLILPVRIAKGIHFSS